MPILIFAGNKSLAGIIFKIFLFPINFRGTLRNESLKLEMLFNPLTTR